MNMCIYIYIFNLRLLLFNGKQPRWQMEWNLLCIGRHAVRFRWSSDGGCAPCRKNVRRKTCLISVAREVPSAKISEGPLANKSVKELVFFFFFF